MLSDVLFLPIPSVDTIYILLQADTYYLRKLMKVAFAVYEIEYMFVNLSDIVDLSAKALYFFGAQVPKITLIDA